MAEKNLCREANLENKEFATHCASGTMTAMGTALPRGVGGAQNPVECVLVPNYNGFGLQATQHKMAAMGALPMVPAAAAAGAAAVNLQAVTGALPRLMMPAMVAADFTAKFAAANRIVVGGEVCIHYAAPIPGGGGWDVPISCSRFDHQVIVREASVVFDDCLAVEPAGKFLAVQAFPDIARCPNSEAKHVIRRFHEYFGLSTRGQLDADGLHFVLGIFPSLYDTMSAGGVGLHDGPGGPIRIADYGTAGDMQLEFWLFVKPGYESPQASAAAMAGFDALHTKLIDLGCLDGAWRVPVGPPFRRDGIYIDPKVHPAWMVAGDRNNYAGMFMVHNYFMSLKRSWRGNTGGRPIAAQNNMMALMNVIPQRAVAPTNFPVVAVPPPVAPPANASAHLPSRSIAFGRVGIP